MNSRLGWVVAAVVLALCAGCGEPRGGPRVETSPLTGKVLVDGTPTANVLVACYPESQSEAVKNKLMIKTDEEGVFSMATYEAGDGVPEGVYRLTFECMEGTLLGKQTDRLKGAYVDPNKSKFEVTVKKGETNDLGEINLTTK